ncbi:hypothetical protein [Kibdelosporangium aridum]|uniref:Minor silk ampullate protein n=1 Tax=Kibdelosporangium aridum TaxID=2030 RepID=A0A1W2A9L3_KIBAR|nr:hypothetical protein [Kibdelosporangium aridum]SMC57415.1 hypothetical protein SAMN05661093_00582 [Kibdelosporangium aridum]
MRARVLGLAAVLGLAVATPAYAQGATVSVSPATADPQYATTLTLQGKGFQSVKNGHGGIYVFFGWVSDPDGGSWRPSKGGASGATFKYVQDRETKDNNGYQRFVAFPGSDTAASANGGVVAENGTWSTRLNIPGPRFKAADRSGGVSEVDCLKSRCGVITVGAHGVVNANNETFTPISFAVPDQQPAPPPQPKATTTTPPAATTTSLPPTTTTSTSVTTTSVETTSEARTPEPAAQAQPLPRDTGPNLWLLIGIPVLVLVAVGGLVLSRRRLGAHKGSAQKETSDE